MKKDDAERVRHPFRNALYLLRIVYRISPARVAAAMTSELFGFGMWVFGTLVFMKFFFGSETFERTYPEALAFIALALGLEAVTCGFNSWYGRRFCLINDQLLHRDLNRMLFDKACRVDIGCYENAQFYESYTRAAREIFSRATESVRQSAVFVSSMLALLFVIAAMFEISPWIGAATLVPVVVNLFFGSVGAKLEYRKKLDGVPFRRRQDYVNRAVFLQKYAKEIRLSGVFSVLMRTYDGAVAGVVKTARRYWKRLFTVNGAKSTISFPLLFEGTWLLGAFLVMVRKSITLPDFVVLSSAIVSSTWMVISFADSVKAQLDNGLYTENLKEFLAYSEAVTEDQPGLPVPERPGTLEFSNVSFAYPGGQKVLSDLNLRFQHGSITSLVGHNGSGKTTLVKLAMRLYDPTEGEILLDGVDIKKYDLREYRDRIGSTFQDYQLFAMSVYDNVLLQNRPDGEPDSCVASALEKSGAAGRVSGLSQGWDTMMTAEFDERGVTLSGGEAQKIAIARAFAKKSGIVLLDEPASALDPVAEYRMMRNFTELAAGKIGILITHRMSTAAMADRIYLLQNGRVTESGTHDELMREGGAYAAMFRRQAENYLLEAEA